VIIREVGVGLMDHAAFIGRELELKQLNDLLSKKTASLVVVNGRRRIGKSRLIEEFAKNKTFYHFSGLAPKEGITAEHQRREFMTALSLQANLPEIHADDWSKLFFLLAQKINRGRVIVLFDEITWLAHGDEAFLSKLKNAWDMYFKKNTKLIFILCGSISAWIEKNIISSTGYFGRISLHLHLTELPLHRCNQLLNTLGFKRSAQEKLLYLSLTGGVPWYIEQVKFKYSALENIKSLCFEENALLVHEYRHVFHDLFGRRSEVYQKIVEALVAGPLDYDGIAKKIDYSKGSVLTRYLEELKISGYISQYFTWDFKEEELSNLNKYRLSDNFLRFHFRFIAPRLSGIQRGRYAKSEITNLPGWLGLIGLQLENLVLNNRDLILEALSINPAEVIADDPYFQRATKRIKGCQIDYLILTKLNTIFVCEIKFSHNPITMNIIKEVQEKIDKLATKRHYAVLPVLIHFNEVKGAVEDSEFFYRIINFSECLLVT